MAAPRRTTRIPCRIIERIYGPGNFDDAGDDLVYALRLSSDRSNQDCYRFRFDRTDPNPWFHAMIFEVDGISDSAYERFFERVVALGLVEENESDVLLYPGGVAASRKQEIEAIRSAIVSKLPTHARWWVGETPLDFDFTAATRSLGEIKSHDVGGEISKSRLGLLVFGASHYAEGGGASSLITVRESDGAIKGLDIERAEAIFSFNSTINRFIQTFDLLNLYLRQGLPLPPDLGTEAKQLDPACYDNSEWRSLIDYLTPK